MRKGVSPVIAIVLLLMMTVAVTGGAYFWFSSVQTGVQETTEEKISQTTEQTGVNFKIASIGCEGNLTSGETNVSLRIMNIGGTELEGGSALLLSLNKGGSTIENSTSLDNTISSNQVSDEMVVGLGNLTEGANKEYDAEVLLKGVRKYETVNCTEVQ